MKVPPFHDHNIANQSHPAIVFLLEGLSSNRLFNTDIFSVPWGVCATSYYSRLEGDHDFLGVTDMSWSRIVGADGRENWVATAGSPGSGPVQFSMPMGICGWGRGFLIADAMNNRVVQVNITIDNGRATGLNDTCYYTACFNYPTDVDYRDPIGAEGCGFKLVADNGNGQIVQICGPATCGGAERIGTLGYGTGQFLNPISVCYGRNSTDHKQNKRIYVADRGNRRVTKVEWYTADPPAHWGFQSFDLGWEADVIAVEVDNFGQVYALDAAQGILFKFSWNLTPIAAYRFHSPDGTTFYPHDFAIGHGIQWNDSAYGYLPIVLGDAFITQSYTGITGVHRYALGVAVLNDSAKYIFRTPTDTDYVRIDYTLTDFAQVTISIRRNGVLRYQEGPLAHVSGPQPTTYWYPASADSSGNYTIEIRAASVYSNSNTHVVTIPLTIDRGFVNHGAYIISGPNLDCTGCTCLEPGHPWGYGLSVAAYDQDGDPLRYFWECTGGLLGNGLDTVTTDSNRVRYYFFGSADASKGMTHIEGEVPLPFVRVTVSDNNSPPVSQQTNFAACPSGVGDGCCCCFNQGDMNGDGAIDVFDVNVVIDIAFSGGGPDPQDSMCPTSRGDVNYDGGTDVFDVIYLIATIFSGGDAPVNPCVP